MSLINKMLKDLETRHNSPLARPVSRPVYQDLHAVSEAGLPRPILPIVAMTVLVLASAAGLVFWLLASTPAPIDNTRQTLVPTPVPETLSPQPVMVEQPEAVAPATPVTSEPVGVAATELPATAQTQTTVEPEPVDNTPVKAVAPGPVVRPPAVTAAKRPAQHPAPVAVPVPTESAATGVSIEKKDIPLTAEHLAENAYRAAAQQLQQRHLTEAETGLRNALASNPRHVAARELLAGLLLLEPVRLEQARELLEQGLAAVPGQPRFITLLARIYVEQNTEPKAIALLEQHRHTKTEPDNLALLATLYQRAARHDEAITAYKDALTLRPQEGKWWVGLGISQEARQNWNEARYAYEQVRVSHIEPRLAQYAEQRLAVVRTK